MKNSFLQIMLMAVIYGALLLTACSIHQEGGDFLTSDIAETAISETVPEATSEAMENSTSPQQSKEERLFYFCMLSTDEEYAYYFELKSDNTLTVEAIPSLPYIVKPAEEMLPLLEETISLSEKEMDEIKDLLINITPSNSMGDYVGIPVIIITFGHPYEYKSAHFSYGLSENENANKLIEKLIHLSPIEVLDENGEEIKPYTKQTT